MAAFRATLEEVQEAAVLLQVSDISNAYHDDLEQEVEKILGELGVTGRPRLRVFNKVDRLSAEAREPLAAAWRRRAPGEDAPLFVSALTGEGLDELLRRVDEALPVDPLVRLCLHVPLSEGRSLALIHALGREMHARVNDSHMDLEAEVPEAMAKRLKLDEFSVKGTPPSSRAYL